MIRIPMYSIFDIKGDRYDTPFFTSNDLFAKRIFMLKMQEEKTFINNWPEDFNLYKVGEFEVTIGVIKQDKILVLEGKQVSKERSNK